PGDRRARLHELLPLAVRAERAPRPVPEPVVPDRHPGPRELANAVEVDRAALPEPAGDQEERRLQPRAPQRGQRDPDVGGVPVVEGDPQARLPPYDFEQLVELRLAHPVLRLVRLELPAGSPDPVEAEVDDR